MRGKILVVDDSLMVREQVKRALVAGGFEAEGAVDGLEALQKLALEPGFGMVLCDINMPRMNGFELMAHMRARPSLAAITVVILSSEGQPEMLRRAKGLGAKSWIIKPAKPELLLEAARKLYGTAA